MKNVSLLFGLHPDFSVVKNVVPDYMHGVLLGVMKNLLLVWFDPSNHKKYFKKNKSYPEYFIGHMVSI